MRLVLTVFLQPVGLSTFIGSVCMLFQLEMGKSVVQTADVAVGFLLIAAARLDVVLVTRLRR